MAPVQEQVSEERKRESLLLLAMQMEACHSSCHFLIGTNENKGTCAPRGEALKDGEFAFNLLGRFRAHQSYR